MRVLWIIVGLSLVPMIPSTGQARGCLSGAVAGGLVGHYAGGHGGVGAAAGCAIGHHEAHERDERERAARNRDFHNDPR